MEHGRAPWLIGQARARTELVRIDILIDLIEAQAVIERELLGQPPLVLSVGPELPAKQFALVENVERRVDRRHAARIVRVERLNCVCGCDAGLLAVRVEAGAKGVRVVQAIREIAGNAVEDCLKGLLKEKHRFSST